jgi:hypothetical protein
MPGTKSLAATSGAQDTVRARKSRSGGHSAASRNRASRAGNLIASAPNTEENRRHNKITTKEKGIDSRRPVGQTLHVTDPLQLPLATVEMGHCSKQSKASVLNRMVGIYSNEACSTCTGNAVYGTVANTVSNSRYYNTR